MKRNMVFFRTNKWGYSPEQITVTMTVGELISHLRQYPDDAKVMYSNDSGYTYGSINASDITMKRVEMDDE